MSAHAPPPVAGRDPLIRFFLLAGSLYVGWYLLYSLVLHPWEKLDTWVIDKLIALSGALLTLFGYALIPEPVNAEQIRTIGVEGGHLLWIGDPCNGVSLFAVYLIFLFAYSGPLKHKWWFGLIGVLSIHLINSLRVVGLCIIVRYDYELLNFNHDYTFYVIVYGWVFLLWYIWVKRFAGQGLPEHTP